MRYIRSLLLGLLITGGILIGGAYAGPTALASQASDDACVGIGGTVSGGECVLSEDEPSVEGIVGTVINIFSLIVGIAAVIMIIFGGFRYITAGGDSGKLSSARQTIIYAIVGLVVVGLAQFIVQFVVNRAT